MASLFFYGSLRHRPLLDLVLGAARDVRVEAATLPDYAVYWAKGEMFPTLVAEAGGVAEGLYVSGLSDTDEARLSFYEGGFDYALVPVEVLTGAGPCTAHVYFSDPGRWPIGAPWVLAEWERDWAAISLRAGAEAMAGFGKVSAKEMAQWLPLMRVRAASWVAAQSDSAPMNLRRGGTATDIKTLDRRRPYSKFFALEENDLRFPRFDGGQSDTVARAAFVLGDAVTVLPYDPVRDRVLIIEQFRFGPLVRGDKHPWSLEPIAGRIDPGETPEVAARREAVEETGLQMNRLEQIARYYPSPGAVTEYLFSYIGIADLPDDIAGLGGAEEEHEDIRSLLLSFEDLMALLASGEAENAPLILSALWLAANRPRLRADA